VGRGWSRGAFIGAVGGEYDVSEYLGLDDGSRPADLAPIPVRVESRLPPGHGTDVYGLADPPFVLVGWYRKALAVIGAAWVGVPVVMLVRRELRRLAVKPPAPPEPAPTLADLLAPLLAAARERGLTVAERGRLELLMFRYWREHLRMAEGAPDRVMHELRRRDDSGPLLTAVERWLHRPGQGAQSQGGNERGAEEVGALLEPFRKVLVRNAPTEAGPMEVHSGTGTDVKVVTAGVEGRA